MVLPHSISSPGGFLKLVEGWLFYLAALFPEQIASFIDIS